MDETGLDEMRREKLIAHHLTLEYAIHHVEYQPASDCHGQSPAIGIQYTE